MKKLFFSGLISCSFFLAAAPSNGQSTRPEDAQTVTAAPIVLHAHAQKDDVNHNVVMLHWSTRDVQNVKRYVIEKSTDSILFNPLHEVVPHRVLDETGDSVYRDEDPYPGPSSNYYRLAILFNNGNKVYSPVVRVEMNLNTAQTPLQRPILVNVNGTLRMSNFYEQPLVVDLYDEGGGHIGSYAANTDSFNINTANLKRGTIIYQILDEHHAFLNAGKILLQ